MQDACENIIEFCMKAMACVAYKNSGKVPYALSCFAFI
jgi:hypothetical protein